MSAINPIFKEGPTGLAELARQLPGSRGKSRMHPATLFRWAAHGVRLPNGETLFLESVRLGNRFISSLPALSRFCEKLAAARQASPLATPAPQAASVDHAAARAAGERLRLRLQKGRKKQAKTAAGKK